jgi:Domain of unknown function (DU1801)
MAANKTQPSNITINAFQKSLEESQREDCKILIKIMKKITGKDPVIWGDNIVGFGTFHYKYASGREGDYFLTGFSPRKANITIYCLPGFEIHTELLQKLGKFKTAKSCLYVKKLSDVDMTILEQLISDSYQCMINHYLKMVS